MLRGLGPAGAGLLTLALLQAARLRTALRVARARSRVQPYSRKRPEAPQRILLLGDSTGVGAGADVGRHSIAAQLARDWPGAEILNLCRSGARVVDTLRLVQHGRADWRRFDLVVLQVGGNDVLRMTSLSRLQKELPVLFVALRDLAPRVVCAGLANVGRAPAFLPPFSWLLSHRTRRVTQLFARCAALHGVAFISFFHERADDPFSARRAVYYASDGLHPSGSAYRYCYARMRPLVTRALR